ncbi:MAG: hypothetical protein ACK552_01705 [Microcystis sp.]|jgi:hypothetical protein
MDLLKNRFVQSLGVGAFFYLLMLSLNWVVLFTLRILESFSSWYRYRAAPYWDLGIFGQQKRLKPLRDKGLTSIYDFP